MPCSRERKWKQLLRLVAVLISGITIGCDKFDAGSDSKEESPIDSGMITVIYATANPESSAHVRHIKKFNELLKIYSKGKIGFEFHVDGEYGSEQDNVMDVAGGDIHMTTVAVNNVTPFAPAVGFMTLPYMFTDIDTARRFFLLPNPILDKVSAEMVEESNIRPLSWLNLGFRVLSNSNRIVRRPEDLRDTNIRVPENSIMVEAYRAWGTEPIPLPWTETYKALESGLIDGQDNSFIVDMNLPMADKPFYRIQKYITNIHYILSIQVHVINEDFYQSLSPDLQEAAMRAARESTVCLWDWVSEENRRIEQHFLSHGMIVTQPADDEREWMRLGRSIWPRFYDDIGGEDFVASAVAHLESLDNGLPIPTIGEQMTCPAPIPSQTLPSDDEKWEQTPIPPDELGPKGEAGEQPPAGRTITLAGVTRCPYLCDLETRKSGFLMEIARAVFEPKGYKIEYTDLPWSRAILHAKQGKVDGLIGVLRKNAPDLVFPTEEQGVTKMRFYVSQDNPWRFEGLVSLRQVKLGVIKDFAYGGVDSYIRKNVANKNIEALTGRNSLIRNIEMLRLGRVTAIIEDAVVMDYTLKALGRANELVDAGVLAEENVYIAFSDERPGAEHLARILSEGMIALRESGKLDAILESYGLSDWKPDPAAPNALPIDDML